MWETIASWTVEVNIGSVLVALGTMAGATMIGYASGRARSAELIDEHLRSVGIHASATENRFEIHEAASDKIAMVIKWDDEFIETEVMNLADQEWDSES